MTETPSGFIKVNHFFDAVGKKLFFYNLNEKLQRVDDIC